MKRLAVLLVLLIGLAYGIQAQAITSLDATKPTNSTSISQYGSYLRETRSKVNELIATPSMLQATDYLKLGTLYFRDNAGVFEEGTSLTGPWTVVGTGGGGTEPTITNPLPLGVSYIQDDSGVIKILNATQDGFHPIQASEFRTQRTALGGYWQALEAEENGDSYFEMRVADALTASRRLYFADVSPADGDVLMVNGGSGAGTTEDPIQYNVRYVSGDSTVSVRIVDPTAALTTGNAKNYYVVPEQLSGYSLIGVGAHVFGESSSGTPTIDIKLAGVTMLTTLLTIDANEKDSATAATAAVIDSTYRTVATGQEIRFDVTVAGTGTLGLEARLRFRKLEE